MEEHEHQRPSGHDPTPTFDDATLVAVLEAVGELATGVAEEALVRCAELLDGGVSAVARIADLGCGPGVAVASLARRFPSATVVGVDASPLMLARVEQRAARDGLAGRVVARRLDLDGDLGALGTFDLVWSSLALHHARDEPAALARFAALLRPRGLLCLLERAEPLVVRPTHELDRPGIWERLAAAQAVASTRSAPADGQSAPGYGEMIVRADLDLLDAATLSETVHRSLDPTLCPLLDRYLRGAIGVAGDQLLAADREALERAGAHLSEIPWGDAAFTSTRALLIARRPAVDR